MKKPILGGIAFLVVVLIVLVVSRQARSAGHPFSNGTLSGTYVFSASGGATPMAFGGTPNGIDIAGTMQFDGAGSVTGTGTLVNTGGNNVGSGVMCTTSFSGTYSVDSAGGLQMTLTVTPADECSGSATAHFTGGTVHNGHAFVFAAVDPTSRGYLAGTGIEQ